jgi:hypothetical protein
MPDYSFGARMRELNAERGVKPPGRRRIADRQGRLVGAAERVFALALPEQAERYVAELVGKEPERCPNDDRVMECPQCGLQSQRTHYDHAAARYVFDRIMGRPTSRSENTLSIALVQQLSSAFAQAFQATNEIEDAAARREAFAAQLAAVTDAFDGAGR